VVKDQLREAKGPEEPFYERLRRQDIERTKEDRRIKLDMQARRSHAAAYSKDGKLLLSDACMDKIAAEDEAKAKKQQDRMNKLRDT